MFGVNICLPWGLCGVLSGDASAVPYNQSYGSYGEYACAYIAEAVAALEDDPGQGTSGEVEAPSEEAFGDGDGCVAGIGIDVVGRRL